MIGIYRSDWVKIPGSDLTLNIGPVSLLVSTADGWYLGFDFNLFGFHLGWQVGRDATLTQ